MVLRFAYTIFLGLLLATFIGVGIAAFYRPPEMPKSQSTPVMPYKEPNASESAEINKEYAREQSVWEDYNKKQRLYDRDVSAAALGFSIVYLVVGLLLANRILLLSDGLLFGSVFTLIYSIVRGFNSQDEIFRFVVVSVGLVVALILGYIKFVKPNNKSK